MTHDGHGRGSTHTAVAGEPFHGRPHMMPHMMPHLVTRAVMRSREPERVST
jgi:hypothetical protein